MALETSILAISPHKHTTPLLALLVPQGAFPSSLGRLDEAVGGALHRFFATGDFTGKRGEAAMVYVEGPADRVLLVGLGTAKELSTTAIREASAIAARRASGVGVPSAALHVAAEVFESVNPRALAQAVAEGLPFGAWNFSDLKRPAKDKRADLRRVDILAPAKTKTMEAGHRIGSAIGAGQWFTRDLQMLPGNMCTPAYLAKVAKKLGTQYRIKVTVLDGAAIKKEGLTALLAVAQGSAEEPRFIVMEYRGARAKTKPVVLVGKGVTFDTGGISIKPATSMEEMKFDMSGAAAVLGAFDVLGRIKPNVNVIGLIPTAENMPSGTALKPGDVITSHLGKTIEIVNTDAEGRLILCDALSYARRFTPACVLDLATLTGAVVIALGSTAIGLMGNDEPLIDAVRAAGERSGERAWPLPLWDDYRELIKSQIADVKNSGGRAAGTITAGWFLREFVEDFAWAHLDIAGTAYSDHDTPSRVKGPTGSGVRLVSDFVLSRKP
ncbi:MAG: leucyl aminopeptidase [Gemmatimonadales bacterium]|nr:leucyl aminopeptidase [Gemmatimonadales bacterium]